MQPIPDNKPDNKPDVPYRCDKSQSTEKQSVVSSQHLNEVNEVMNVFFNNQTILDSKGFFGRKAYRDACQQLIDRFGFKETKMMVLQALTVQDQKFAPVINNPLQLRDKIDALKNYLTKEIKEKLSSGCIELPIRDDLPEEEKANRIDAHKNGRITISEMNEMVASGISVKGRSIQS